VNYTGTDALEVGLADELGTQNDVETRIGELPGIEPSVYEFESSPSLIQQAGIAAERVAFGAGNGVVNTVGNRDRDIDITLK
jgi:protease-4